MIDDSAAQEVRPIQAGEASEAVPKPVTSAGNWRLMLSILVWFIVATQAVGFVAGVWEGSVTARGPPGPFSGATRRAWLFAAHGAAVQCVLLAVSWRKARLWGAGNVAVGLGNFAIRRRWLMVALAALLLGVQGAIVSAILWVPAIARAVHSDVGSAAFEGVSKPSPWAALPVVLVLAVLGPIAEECFFRGWLWTALRRRNSPLVSGILTGAPFLLAHWPDGFYRPLILLPSTVLFTLARHYGGSVRASIALHCLNNGAVAALLLGVRLLDDVTP